MKQRSTTPVFASFAAKATLIVAAVLIAVAGPIQSAPVAKADRFDDQINAIQRQIDQYDAAAGNLQNVANDLQQKVTSLNVEKSQIQAQVDINQLKYDQLLAKITETEAKIADNKTALGDTIANIYVDGTISPLEMLASSKNIGDYVDKQELQSSVRDELTTTIGKIKVLKKQLETQKSDLEKVLADQKIARDALAAKEAEQQKLLNDTRGEQAAYQKLSADNQAQQTQIRQQQQAAIAAAYASSGGGTVIASGQLGEYPWNSSNCAMGGPGGYYSYGGSDGNGGDGRSYGCRQCASYAAWRVAKETGRYPIGWGNATNFPQSARNAGYATGSSPRANSLAVLHNGAEGHVAWVESVSDDESSIIVSQYNYNYGAGYGMYSKMKLSAGAFQEYVYIK